MRENGQHKSIVGTNGRADGASGYGREQTNLLEDWGPAPETSAKAVEGVGWYNKRDPVRATTKKMLRLAFGIARGAFFGGVCPSIHFHGLTVSFRMIIYFHRTLVPAGGCRETIHGNYAGHWAVDSGETRSPGKIRARNEQSKKVYPRDLGISQNQFAGKKDGKNQ